MSENEQPPEDDTPSLSPETDNSVPVVIESEMKKSYLDYAMSVIISRALPDVRDGLKPVHRRILYAMQVGGNTPDKPYRKSANIVGAVMGNFHPHGDNAIYDALVRMAQPFSMGLLLVDGQGNFGSIDNDPPAAMRYTESRMTKAATYLLEDIDKKTVDFQDTYDGSQQEPTVLPARFPNLLVNGAAGIAVGMATNIPPHNLGEVIDASLAILDNPDISDDELLEKIPGPDFPTGGLIMGKMRSRKALLTGNGSIIVRAKSTFETLRSGRQAIVFHDVPFQVNKAEVHKRISELASEDRISGVHDVRDESDRVGIRFVVELKANVSPEVALNQIYRTTRLQDSFSVNLLALNGGKPEQLNVRKVLEAFLKFRDEVVTLRTKHELGKARDRGHILVGNALALANIDDVIKIIRQSSDNKTARAKLMETAWPANDMADLIALIDDPRTQYTDREGYIRFSEEQARAILELRLHRLTAIGREEIDKEAKELRTKIADYLDILRSPGRVKQIIKDELTEVREKFAVPRRSEFSYADMEIDDEDLIEREDMIVTVTHGGYIKRTRLETYRTQRRGGKGRTAMSTKDDDFVVRMFKANTHSEVLFFSSHGMVYKEKVWRIVHGQPQARGKALINMFPLADGERIESVLPLPVSQEERDTLDVMFATRSGKVRRNKLSDFVRVNRAGKIAMKLDDDDGIVAVRICSDENDILLASARGQCVRFPVSRVRVFAGRNSVGVRGIRLAKNDSVIALSVLGQKVATTYERYAYLRRSLSERQSLSDEEQVGLLEDSGEDIKQEEKSSSDTGHKFVLEEDRYQDLKNSDQMILTIAENGFGKRTSIYDYRVSGRGGKGIVAQKLAKNQRLAQTLIVEDDDEIMLITDGGQLIRTRVDQIRQVGRNSLGVRIHRISDNERVVAVARIADMSDGEDIVSEDESSRDQAEVTSGA